jgi:hypothetical protein
MLPRDLELTVTRSTKKSVPVKNVEPAKWTAPPQGYAKINVDAVVRKQGEVGAVAAVCRSDDGVYQGASAAVMQGVVDPTC